MMNNNFLNTARLMRGPWQAFERDIARLMLQNGFEDVRLVGGPGENGADVLGIKAGKLWVFQCKHTTSGPPPKAAVNQVVEAGRFYKADRLVVAVSRPPGDSFLEEIRAYARQGLHVELVTPDWLLSLSAKSPEYPPSRRELRDYQRDAAELFREGLIDTGRGQINLATGLGKTVIMAETVADLLRDNVVGHGRVLVLAHTRELVNQLHQSFWHQLPKWIPTQQFADGEKPVDWNGIVFATVQSILSNLGKLPYFGLVLVDEAHHIGASTFLRVIDSLSPQMLGGVTATPWRGDSFDLNRLLGPPLVQIGIEEGLRRGFLCDVDYRLHADNLDWEFVKNRSSHRYSISQLNRRLIIPTRDDEAARIIKNVFDAERRRGGIVFCPTQLHAHEMSATLRRYGLKAETITGEMRPRERAAAMLRFRAGELDMVTSVDLFNEGVDVPDVDLLVFMRATHSRRIFVQQLGRGLRLSTDKDKVIVLDFVTDLRRMAEVIELDQAMRNSPVERLGLGNYLLSFHNESAGSFMREWMLDQASLLLREGDANLDLPQFDFPAPRGGGSVQ